MEPYVLYIVWGLIVILNLVVGALFLVISGTRDSHIQDEITDYSVTPDTDSDYGDLTGYHRAIFIAPFILLLLLILMVSLTGNMKVICTSMMLTYIFVTVVLILVYLSKETNNTFNMSYQLSPLILSYCTLFILSILYLYQEYKSNGFEDSINAKVSTESILI